MNAGRKFSLSMLALVCLVLGPIGAAWAQVLHARLRSRNISAMYACTSSAES